jgi:RNA polymerase sigma-70 factor (ECF subfamily)
MGLREAFLSAVPEGARRELDTPELAATLSRLWKEGQAAHPTLTVDAERFARELGARRAERELDLGEIVAGDFTLALAALAGDRGAISTFEATVMAPLTRKLGSLTRDAEVVDLTVRTVRESMFVGTERRRPKLAMYTGQVPLGAFVLLVGKRELASLARKRPREVPVGDAEALDGQDPHHDPELETLLHAHRGAFEQVVLRVMARLPPEERDLLRWNVKEGASIDTIAPRLGVNRATVARRLARVREKLSEEVREELRSRLRLGTQTFDSLCHKMMPELDVSLSKVL